VPEPGWDVQGVIAPDDAGDEARRDRRLCCKTALPKAPSRPVDAADPTARPIRRIFRLLTRPATAGLCDETAMSSVRGGGVERRRRVTSPATHLDRRDGGGCSRRTRTSPVRCHAVIGVADDPQGPGAARPSWLSGRRQRPSAGSFAELVALVARGHRPVASSSRRWCEVAAKTRSGKICRHDAEDQPNGAVEASGHDRRPVILDEIGDARCNAIAMPSHGSARISYVDRRSV